MTEEEEKDIDLIERYHNGALGDDELQSFKDRLATDPSFAQKTEDFRDIFIGIKAQGEKNFVEEVRQWEQEITNHKSFALNWKIAAGIILLIAATVYIYYPKQNETDLFTAYFTPYEDVISVRGEQAPMDAYNRKDYAAAVRELSTSPGDLNTKFYLGVSLIANGEAGKGVEALDEVITGNGMLKEQAEWYRALGLIQLKKIDEARSALQSINQPGHDYQEKAGELLEKL